MHYLRRLTPAIAAAALLAGGPALAAGEDTMRQDSAQPDATNERADVQTEAGETVQEAAAVAERLRADPDIAGLLEQSQGVFIVPDLVRGAFIVGASGGDGVLMARQNGDWSPPAFYSLGSISIGAQGGGDMGAVAMILMSDEAMQRFREDDNFSISADAGLTIVDYSASAQAELQESDVVVWSDRQGAFVGASITASDIGIDEEANQAYYDQNASPQTILSGDVQRQQGDALQEALRP